MRSERPEDGIAINPIVLGSWFAILAGLGDVVLFFLTSVLLRRYVPHSPQLIWISPVSNLILFALPGVVIWAFTRWLPARHWSWVAAFLFAFLTAWGLSIYAPHVHSLASFVLAVGIAAQTARLINAHPAGTRRLVRYTMPVLAAVVILGGLGVNAWERIKERRAVETTPPATQGLPNVLLIILDTVRAANLGLYGYSRPTSPALEQFAKRGVVFDFAISASPWTMPSHATMFTGRWPLELSANWRTPLDATYPTLAEALLQRGYTTAGFVANRYYAGRKSGLARGFQQYDDLRLSFWGIVLGSALGRSLTYRPPLTRLFGYYDVIGRERARNVNTEVLDWLSNRGATRRPFFVFLNYYDAHDPYIAPPPFDTLFDRERLPAHPGLDPDTALPQQDLVREVAAYDESLAQLDHELGLLFRELEQRGALRNTAVIIAADHGEELGEHGLWRHGKSLYLQELRVPLLIVFDGRVPAGARVRQPVSLRDLPATILDLVHAPSDNAGSSAPFPGRSLARYWNGEVTVADTADAVISEVRVNPTRSKREPASRGDMVSLIDGTRHLIRNGDGVIEMYQIDADPDELRNVASRPELRDSVQELASRLRSIPTNKRR